ncbi:MAG TPA: acyl-CoA dehydrogenase family protein [Microthrixaceae bacterium]|jgi:alkylation response protein AidB-like acyl-CoA dehydrogenase|nr:acyl-CoA dehydrogenase family protein [Microthrixaceae bacterium]
MLNLDFTEEQDMLREMVRGVCEQYANLDVVRAMEDDAVGYPVDLWAQLAELGILGMTIPEEHGGSGMTMQEGVVVYEELGRALAPLPHLVSAVVSAGAILTGGSAEQIAEWVPKLASGEAIFTPAWTEPDNGFGPKGVQVEAVADGDGFTITGTKQHVYFASSAQRLIVLARTGAEPAAIDLFLVDPAADGVTLTQKMSISSDTQYRVDFAGVRVSAADRIGPAGSGWATWQTVMNDAMILQAAYANGGNEHALDITVQYSKDREQFDKPLGAFQALSHDMADAKTALDGSKVLNYEAAWAHSLGRPVTKLAAMSKLFACNSYRDTTAMAQQIFGGVGFTLEYEIQLYFRRAKQQQITWNDTRTCEDLIAAAVLDESAA